MLSTLLETKQKLSVYITGLSTAIRNRYLRSEDIRIGASGVYRTAQETQDYLKNSPQGRALGVSHLL